MISVVYFDLLRSEELLEFVRCGPELQEQIVLSPSFLSHDWFSVLIWHGELLMENAYIDNSDKLQLKKKFKGLHIFKQYIKQMQTAYKCFNLQNYIFCYFPLIIAFLIFHKYFTSSIILKFELKYLNCWRLFLEWINFLFMKNKELLCHPSFQNILPNIQPKMVRYKKGVCLYIKQWTICLFYITLS